MKPPGNADTDAGRAADSPSTAERIFFAVLVVAAGIGLCLGWLASRKPDAPSPRKEARRLAEFRLTERSGRIVERDDLTHLFLVVNFVFTGCDLGCRVVNDRLAELQQRLTNAKDVRLVSISIDPRTDTPAVLSKFAASYQADPERWWFLTGDKADVYDLLEASFLTKSDQPIAGIPGGFLDTDRIMLVNPLGVVCASFNGLSQACVPAVLAAIEQERQHPSPP